MAICTECRINETHYTRYERIRRWFFHLFSEDIQDLRDETYTRGFGEGYEKGFTHLKQAYAESQRPGLAAGDDLDLTPLEETDKGQASTSAEFGEGHSS